MYVSAHPQHVIGPVFHAVKSTGGRVFINPNIIPHTPAQKHTVVEEVVGSSPGQKVECLDLTVAGTKHFGVGVEI